eukprot:449858-Amphidinium_carterae.1
MGSLVLMEVRFFLFVSASRVISHSEICTARQCYVLNTALLQAMACLGTTMCDNCDAAGATHRTSCGQLSAALRKGATVMVRPTVLHDVFPSMQVLLDDLPGCGKRQVGGMCIKEKQKQTSIYAH